MRFVKETVLFAPSGTLKRFQGLETSFKVEQGKISALISDSELIELKNGNKTMCSRLYSAEQTVSGLDKLYTDISGKYDAVSGQYTDLDTKVAEYKESVDGFSADLTKLSNHVKDDYSTTQAMETYVKATIEGVESTVSQTYVTTEKYGNGIEDAKKSAGTQASEALSSAKSYADDVASGALEDAKSDATEKANATLKDAKADVTERLKSYSTTEQMTSAINQKAGEITLSVSKTYTTTKQFDSYKENMGKLVQARIDAKADSIQAWVEDTSFQDQCVNGDFSDGIHNWTDGGYTSGVSINTDEEYGKYAAISSGYLIGQIMAAGPQRITITFDAKTMMSSGSQVTVTISEAGYQIFDLTYNKWEHFSMTIENLAPAQKHTITFKATKSLCNVCITNIKFLENASDYASARIQVFSDKISSTVQKDGIISAINQTAESVKIKASKISFDGLVTANSYFKINTDGSMEAKAGTIAGWKIETDGFTKGGMEIHNAGSISDMDDFTSDYTTCIYPDGIVSKTIKGELIYNSTEYGGYTGTLKVMTGSNTYKTLVIRNGCIVVKHV